MSLIKSIKIQLCLMIHKVGFQLSFTIVFTYCISSYLKNLIMYTKLDISNFYSANFLYCGNGYATFWGIFQALFPFLVVFPFSFSYIDDLHVNIVPYVNGRMNNKYYYIGKLLTSFIGGFIIIFIPFLLNLILCNLTFSENNNTLFGPYNLVTYNECITGKDVYIHTSYKGMSFLHLYIKSPFLYNILYLFILSIFSGTLSTFATACSFLIKKHKVVVFIPVYLLILLFRNLDSYAYLQNQKYAYINYDLMDYININVEYGRNYVIFCLVLALLFIFSYLCALFMSKKDNL